MCPESGTGTSPATGSRSISVETASCYGMFFEVKKKILEVALSLTGADEEDIEVS